MKSIFTNIVLIVFLLSSFGCVENLGLGSCMGDCPLNQTCIDYQCGCEEGTEKLGDRCFNTVDGFYIGSLNPCIGRIGFSAPDNGMVKYRLDSSEEGLITNVIRLGETYLIKSFTSCEIENIAANADIYLRIEDQGKMAVKVQWMAVNNNLTDPLLKEINAIFALPVKYNSPITPR